MSNMYFNDLSNMHVLSNSWNLELARKIYEVIYVSKVYLCKIKSLLE